MKKNKFILVGLLITLPFTIIACENNITEKISSEISKQSSTINENIKSEKEDKSKQKKKKKSKKEAPLKMGKSGTLKDWEISVTDMQIVDAVSDDLMNFAPDEDGDKYAQVFVTVNNSGKNAGTFLPSYGLGDAVGAKIIYGDGYEFSSTILLGYKNELHDSTINPLSSKTGEIVFSIPDLVANETDEMILEFSSGNKTLKFKIR